MSRLPPPEKMSAVDYSSAYAPTEYHCGKCGKQGVKLWREYNTFLEHQSLLCGSCACVEQNREDKTFSVQMTSTGVEVSAVYRPDPFGLSDLPNGSTIGWRIPAVPTADGETYWGYPSVPSDGVAWWNRLPL